MTPPRNVGAAPVVAASLDPAREAAALETQRRRKIHPQWAPDGWRCYAAGRPGQAIDPVPYADPVEALEAGEAALAAAEARAAERSAAALLAHLQSGLYFVRPVDDPQGGKAFQIRRASDGSLVEVKPGLAAALLRIGELNNPPATPAVES